MPEQPPLFSEQTPSAFVVGGTSSSCGKTSICLALLAACKKRAYMVQSFKVGPDFIDPLLHQKISQRPCINLDSYFFSPEQCRELLEQQITSSMQDSVKTLALVEGVMGIFDGIAFQGENGSTAQMAKILNLPAVLVIDAKACSRSIAAIVKGFSLYDPNLNIVAVICNNIGSDRHKAIVTEAIQDLAPDLPLLACLPKNPKIALQSRHLGLIANDETQNEQYTDELATWLEEHLDLEKLLLLTQYIPQLSSEKASESNRLERQNKETYKDPTTNYSQNSCLIKNISLGTKIAQSTHTKTINTDSKEEEKKKRKIQQKAYTVQIALAYDKAFSFYYETNIQLLKKAGARINYFSPLTAPKLPPHTRAIIFGGGYPELYAEQLSNNTAFKKECNSFFADGGFIWASGGGMLYTLDQLDTGEKRFPMLQLLPYEARMNKTRQALGYREATLLHNCFLSPAQQTLRGHEFHYSSIQVKHQGAETAKQIALVKTPDQKQTDSLFVLSSNKRLLASYMHISLLSNSLIADFFIRNILHG